MTSKYKCPCCGSPNVHPRTPARGERPQSWDGACGECGTAIASLDTNEKWNKAQQQQGKAK